jgi:hypothetical protein
VADTNNYKVRLIAVSSIISGISSSTASQVIFEVTPTFSESREAVYESIEPIHMPGGMQIYKRTSARKFSIGAHFISRTSREATDNLQRLQLLRGWQMPYFGLNSSTIDATHGSTQAAARAGAAGVEPVPQSLTPQQRADAAIARGKSEGIELLGAPPDVLYLYAYSTSDNNDRSINYGVNINRVPVVLTSLDISYPDDVDYLPTFANTLTRIDAYDNTSEPFPIKMDVSISLMETHSPREYEQFNLAAYKIGNLTNF